MILGIVGSYRKNGTIDLAVASILSAARNQGAETKTIYLRDFNIEFCTNCRQCTQEPGPVPGRCYLTDDMPDLIREIESADAFVLGAPVNAGNVNALTQRFLERLICYSFWPWGQQSPQVRKKKAPLKRAVLVTSSAMPSIMGKWLTGALKGLKLGTKMIGAKPVMSMCLGLSAMQEKACLPKSFSRKALDAARNLCRS